MNKQNNLLLALALFLGFFALSLSGFSQTAMQNIAGRNCINLNGQWPVIIDPTGTGNWRQVWKSNVPQNKTQFFEYSFDGGPKLNVPGDFNTQHPDLKFMEGTVWYQKKFNHLANESNRYFIHFGAVNYTADVYLNEKLLGGHEGGFTPFQFEITNDLIEGENILVVKVNNERHGDGLPGYGYDWMNYGGIIRDVNLVQTPTSYIDDYFIQLKKSIKNEVEGWVKINGQKANQKVEVVIPELKINYSTQSNSDGFAKVEFKGKFDRWSPTNPKLYEVIVQSETDTIRDEIGFRNIDVEGAKITLNGEPIFLKGINIHEEMPLRAAKAYTETDALVLLTWAKELGCNLVRLAHYPHNEYMVKMAEKMGIMVWDELPIYQHIQFSTPGVEEKMDLMLREMIKRDRNRAGVVIWSLSNETYQHTANRDSALVRITKKCRDLDNTRLITHVINSQGYNNNTFNVWEHLYQHCDVISLNEYIGWYVPWQGKPSETKWKFDCTDKPVIISEFGGEALYGSNYGPSDEAAWWTEEFQEQIYIKQTEMFETVPNLCGLCPWLLVDYRSLGRMHPVFQQGWNRKGLLSDKGQKKKAWYVMKKYYDRLDKK
ncbi:MAG: beta-glucuronidase [Prolixibacteraceae bacterium]|jgi:beta-glucuronidase|nr:beta-glucuronidase [Prolixibacteraceae bacterium]